MHSVHIQNANSPLFKELWKTYEVSFPASERRSLVDQIKILHHPRYRLEAWMNDDERGGPIFVGLMGWWEYDDFRYLEHLAISPVARSGGMGGKILLGWMSASEKPVFLEIDVVTDDISRRRLGFYQRLGFVENDMKHSQPDFQGKGGAVPLRVLSYPGSMSRSQYAALDNALQRDVWPKAAS